MLFAQSLTEYGALDRLTAGIASLWAAFWQWVWNSPREQWVIMFSVALVALWFWKRPKKF
jgi:hypothetical protein